MPLKFQSMGIFWCGLLLVGCSTTGSHPTNDAAPKKIPERPHIVVILADDLGWGDLAGSTEQSRIATPQLARLAAEGVRFTDAHSPSAVCTPTRYGLLTGRYAWRSSMKQGVLGGRSPALIEPTRVTLPALLQEAGYRTSGAGKWHLGLQAQGSTDYSLPLVPGPTTAGFQRWWGIPASLDMAPYLYFEDDQALAQPTEKIEASGQARHGGKGFWRGGAIAPGFRHDQVLPDTAARAVTEIERHHQLATTDPLFLYVALSAPHTPWLPSRNFQGNEGAGVYGSFVADVDAVVGEILDALDRTSMADDTLLFFTSDNGAHWTPDDEKKYPHRANGAWRGQKADIHEGGHRVPLLVRWPRRIDGQRLGQSDASLVGLTDLMPTIAEAVGAPIPPGAAPDGISFLDAILNGDAGQRQSIVHHSLHGMFAIRSGEWKWIEGLGSGGFTRPRQVKPEPGEPSGQLYHLREDPSEQVNRAAREPAVVERLQRQLDAVRNRITP
ncbi:MAG: arylsulfatase [Planctomycetota bacterium]|jgi:arylsulfatase A-like enzyme|nr:arylsulfatase [Planctomycetota bacterium]